MESQSYSNHARYVPLYHYVLSPILVLTFIGSLVNLWQSVGDHQRIYSASLITVLVVCTGLAGFFARVFALKAQDRAIRAEENLRHYVLTGKLLDPRLDTLQIVALRFAPDSEFVELSRKAAEQNMPPAAIKKEIRTWRPDLYRV